jgi:hypothetical protein
MDHITTKQIEAELDTAIKHYQEDYHKYPDTILLKPMYMNLLLDSIHYQYMCGLHNYRSLEIIRTEDIQQPFKILNLQEQNITLPNEIDGETGTESYQNSRN